MDKMRLAVHFGSRGVLVLRVSAAFFFSRVPCASFASLRFPCAPSGLRLLLLPRFVLCDKKGVLFCGFTEANFFATWGNAENRRSRSQKSTEKWGVFIMGDFVVRKVDRVRRMNKAILGCAWNRRCACWLRVFSRAIWFCSPRPVPAFISSRTLNNEAMSLPVWRRS